MNDDSIDQGAAPDHPILAIDPATRARVNLDRWGRQIPPDGVPIEVRGKTWVLAWMGSDPTVDAERDEVFNFGEIRGKYAMRPIFRAAWAMLRRNYDLDEDETFAVLDAADRGDLAEAVDRSLIPHALAQGDMNYSAWMRSALLANGIDPAKLPRGETGAVLHQLILTGRAAKFEQFVPASQHAALVAAMERGS